MSTSQGWRAYCSVPNCGNRGGQMHRFPKDDNARLMWKFLCKVKRMATDTMFVCRSHFRGADVFQTRKGLFRLHRGVLPCLKLPKAIPEKAFKGERGLRKCAVRGCVLDAFSQVSQHFFPRSSFRRIEWKRLCEVQSSVSRNTVICSAHFLESDFNTQGGRKTLKWSAMPSQHLPGLYLCDHQNCCYFPPTLSVQELPQRKSDQEICDSHSAFWTSFVYYPETFGVSKETVEEVQHNQNDNLDSSSSVKTDIAQLLSSLLNTPKENFVEPVGLPGHVTVLCMLCNDSQWRGLFGVSRSMMIYLTDLVSDACQRAPDDQLTLMETIALTLCKVHLNVPFYSLSLLFGVKYQLSITYFSSTVLLLASVLKCTVSWPLRSEVKVSAFHHFQNFPNARVLLEKIVLPVSEPVDCCSCNSHLEARFAGKLSVKFFVGYAPSGLVTFVSKLYSVDIPDDKIFEDSFRDKKNFQPFVDAVIVERGVNVSHTSNAMNIQIYYPALHQDRKSVSFQTSPSLHPVNLVSRNKSLKSLKIFQGVLSWSTACQLIDIATVAASVLNLMSCSGQAYL